MMPCEMAPLAVSTMTNDLAYCTAPGVRPLAEVPLRGVLEDAEADLIDDDGR